MASKEFNALAAEIRRLRAEVETLKVMGDTVEDEIARIPGRRVPYFPTKSQDFTSSNDGLRGSPMNFLISQDGPFVMTHMPFATWKSSAPSNATDFGRWRPVSSWDLPSQDLGTNIIDLSFEMSDSGSNRLFQDIAFPGNMFSQPGEWQQLAEPAFFRPQSIITITPTYEDITFEGSTATTQGTLVVTLIGYKIINLG